MENQPRVIARRDDGASLVAFGDAALLVSENGRWLTTVDAALARGGWEEADASADDVLSPGEADRLRQADAELQAMNPPERRSP